MTHTKKTVKFAQEKKLNRMKNIWRNRDRLHKYEDTDDTKVIEDPRAQDNFEKDFEHWKRCRDPKDPLYQPPPRTLITQKPRGWGAFKPLKTGDLYEKPRTYWDGESHLVWGWDQDIDDFGLVVALEKEPLVKWWNNKIVRDEYDMEDDWFD